VACQLTTDHWKMENILIVSERRPRHERLLRSCKPILNFRSILELKQSH
jgi:hypothetical protein